MSLVIQVRMVDGEIFEVDGWKAAMEWLTHAEGYKISFDAPDSSHRLVLHADGSWRYLTLDNPTGGYA